MFGFPLHITHIINIPLEGKPFHCVHTAQHKENAFKMVQNLCLEKSKQLLEVLTITFENTEGRNRITVLVFGQYSIVHKKKCLKVPHIMKTFSSHMHFSAKKSSNIRRL